MAKAPGRPKAYPVKKLVALSDEQMERISEWRKAQNDAPTESETFRRLLQVALDMQDASLRPVPLQENSGLEETLIPNGTKGFMLRMPPELHVRVSSAAKANGRSINAELNERLKGSFLNSVLGRLDWLASHLKDKAHKAPFNLSILAEQIGEESVGRLERVFAGLEEPPFSLLDTLAAHCAVNPAWLKHGVGKPFDPVPSPEQGDAP
jgi:predicted DNA-binding protein